ncbi:Cell division trigger factor [Anaerovibrio sp. JC8]|uniref:trigger factor n=1 Tax=Anaerovibrio sp. JC8 TaxID=1240085 RepID=UPI000A0EB069|nr:trigger factor [Anaerovibrio sp. JC8]ORU00815.1 Cell division trigger factor [Anaerovibrio sp. JC8]
MEVSVKDLENQQVELNITVPAAELSKAYDAAAKKIAGRVNIPGFRKGKAPKNIVERHVGKQYIMTDAFEMVAPKALDEALKQEQLEIVTRPEIDVDTLELGKDLVFKAVSTKKPEVELGEYKGLKVEVEKDVVDDEAVQQQLVRMLDRQADMVEAEEGAAVEKDNFITLDFKGFVDGEAFAGGEGKDYPLQIGSNAFIPGFEDQLIGAKVGEEKEVNVTFPEEYHSEELKGKPAVFKCTVKSIKKKVLPELNDDFAKKASTFQTLDELKADLKSNLEKSAETKAESEKREKAINMAADNAKVDIPEIMVENRVNAMIQEMSLRLEQQGLKLEQYMAYAGTDITKLRENYKETAASNVKVDLVLEAIAKAEGIKVEAEDLDNEVATMAAAYGATPAQVKKIIAEQGRLGDLAGTVLRRKTANFVIDSIAQ